MTFINAEEVRVWWIPQVPMKPFHVAVSTEEEAILILDTLALYDIFQYENSVKPDYCNAGGLEAMYNGEWTEYYDKEDRDIDEIMKARAEGGK